ncbi:hypothetical protein TSUD_239210 [Trifolium subterraneum]|uniref:Uncharacterized protein n=1 Tax=Trifolium subterraneum TaxID=3900 RepID=A0A2Z6PU16_TRISU|nr:hypothetical protein TSUD_239210 [Trifolium subterraneum]
MIHNVCLHSIFPRKGSKDKVTHNDMMIMYHLSQQIKLNLPYVLIQHMINTFENENKKVTLPYGMFLTRIFREFKVSFVGEESKNTYTTFTTRNIDRMKKAEDVSSEDHGQKRKREIFEQNANLDLLAEVVTTQEDRLENILPTSVPCDKGKEILPEGNPNVSESTFVSLEFDAVFAENLHSSLNKFTSVLLNENPTVENTTLENPIYDNPVNTSSPPFATSPHKTFDSFHTSEFLRDLIKTPPPEFPKMPQPIFTDAVKEAARKTLHDKNASSSASQSPKRSPSPPSPPSPINHSVDSSLPAQTKTIDHVEAVSNTVHGTVEIEHARQSPVKTLVIGQIYIGTIPITCQPLDIQPLNTEHPPHDENRTQQSKPSSISKKSKKSKKSKSVDSSRIRRSNRIATGGGRKPAIDTNVYTIIDEDSEETLSDSSPTKSAPDIRTYSRRPSSSKSLPKTSQNSEEDYLVKNLKKPVPLINQNSLENFEKFSKRKPVLPSRVFNFNDLINTDHDLTKYTTPLGWTKLFNIKETYYPSLISAFYFNAVVLSEKDQIVSDLK